MTDLEIERGGERAQKEKTERYCYVDVCFINLVTILYGQTSYMADIVYLHKALSFSRCEYFSLFTDKSAATCNLECPGFNFLLKTMILLKLYIEKSSVKSRLLTN
jgi:hypothetical protein